MIAEEKSFVEKVTPAIVRQKFANGLVLVCESMPHARSVSVGMWLRAGSRREPAALNGIAHFIEHMVFKGTTNRSAEDIAGLFRDRRGRRGFGRRREWWSLWKREVKK